MSGKKGFGRTPARHMVAGVPMTVREAAEMLGITESALRHQQSNHPGVSLDYIVRQYREGWINRGVRPPEKHYVRGEWITEEEAAVKYGGTKQMYKYWRAKHRQPDGRIGTLAMAVDYYTGVTPRLPKGRQPRIHVVHGKPLTLYQAAEKLGCTPARLYQIMWRDHIGLAAAMRKAEQLDRRRAEREILRILNGE